MTFIGKYLIQRNRIFIATMQIFLIAFLGFTIASRPDRVVEAILSCIVGFVALEVIAVIRFNDEVGFHPNVECKSGIYVNPDFNTCEDVRKRFEEEFDGFDDEETNPLLYAMKQKGVPAIDAVLIAADMYADHPDSIWSSIDDEMPEGVYHALGIRNDDDKFCAADMYVKHYDGRWIGFRNDVTGNENGNFTPVAVDLNDYYTPEEVAEIEEAGKGIDL